MCMMVLLCVVIILCHFCFLVVWTGSNYELQSIWTAILSPNTSCRVQTALIPCEDQRYLAVTLIPPSIEITYPFSRAKHVNGGR